MARKRAVNVDEVTDDRRNETDIVIVSEGSDFFSQLISLDTRLTKSLAICADKASSLGSLRPIMKLLELSCHGVPWILGNIIALLMSHRQDMREKLLNLFAALMLDLVIVVIVKAAVRRRRPAHNDMDMFATMSVDKFSFPSGHTTRAATVAWFFLDHFPGGLIWSTSILVWTACVSLSRVLLGRHHVLDVVCGLAIGLLQYQLLVHFLWLPPDLCETILGPMQEELHL